MYIVHAGYIFITGYSRLSEPTALKLGYSVSAGKPGGGGGGGGVSSVGRARSLLVGSMSV